MVEVPLRQRWSEMLFGVRRSIRYHARRKAFFERLGLWKNALTLTFGLGTVGALYKQHPDAAIWIAAAVSVVSALDLVVGTTRRAQIHHDFCRKFTGLEQRLLKAAEPSEEVFVDVCHERLALEAEEPPVKLVLDSILHNELARAEGFPKSEMIRVTRSQRLLANFVDLHEEKLVRIGDVPAA